MSQYYEIIYTSSPQLLCESGSGLGVVAATKGTPEQFLVGRHPHRTFPMGDVAPSDAVEDVPSQYVLGHIDGRLQVSRTSYIGVDHTGRTNLLSHEFVCGDQGSHVGVRPSEVFAEFLGSTELKRWDGGPRWLDPMDIGGDCVDRVDARRDVLKHLLPNVAANVLTQLTTPVSDCPFTIVVPRECWHDTVPSLITALLRCLPVHLQSGVVAYPTTPRQITAETRLVVLPEGAAITREVRVAQDSMLEFATQAESLQNASVMAGYGATFMANPRLQQIWEQFTLVGEDGWHDTTLLVQYNGTRGASAPRRLAAALAGVSHARSASVRKWFHGRCVQICRDAGDARTELEGCVDLLLVSVSGKQILSCLRAVVVRATLASPRTVSAGLLTLCARWLLADVEQRAIDGSAADLLGKVLYERFDELNLPNMMRSSLVDRLVPTGADSMESVAWAYAHTHDKKFLRRGAVILSRDVMRLDLASVCASAECANLVSAMLSERSCFAFVNAGNAGYVRAYLAGRYGLGEMPAWWPQCEPAQGTVTCPEEAASADDAQPGAAKKIQNGWFRTSWAFVGSTQLPWQFYASVGLASVLMVMVALSLPVWGGYQGHGVARGIRNADRNTIELHEDVWQKGL